MSPSDQATGQMLGKKHKMFEVSLPSGTSFPFIVASLAEAVLPVVLLTKVSCLSAGLNDLSYGWPNFPSRASNINSIVTSN